VLNDVWFTVEPGEVVGLIGPNGAGKSTLLRSILALTPSSGAVTINGSDAARMGARERALKIAYLAQDREIAWAVPAEMVVSLGRAPHRAPFAPMSARDRDAVDTAIRRMEIEPFRQRPATELSGGEKARVLIARALAQETPLLIADEPTAGLDPSHQITLMRLFRDIAHENRAVIASLHDLGLAARWCTRLLLLDKGGIVADGLPHDVLTRETLRTVYGVTAFIGHAEGGPVVQPLELAKEGKE
jgi:iron complex transport system ATP-binding protein